MFFLSAILFYTAFIFNFPSFSPIDFVNQLFFMSLIRKIHYEVGINASD